MNQSQIDRLSKLGELRASGTLTDAEFDAQKAKVLQGSHSWPLYLGGGALLLCGAAAVGMWLVPSTTLDDKPLRLTSASTAPVPSPSPVAAIRSPTGQLSDAFRAATGRSEAFTETIKGESITTTPLRIIDLPFGRALLTQREIKDGCHACPGHINVFYLGERDGTITVTRKFEEAVSGWAWGRAPTFSISNKFTAFPAIYATGGDMHQGYAESGATITELTPNGPVEAGYIDLGSDNEGAITEESEEAVCTVDGTIANIVRDKSFDVVMTGSANYRVRYIKRGGKFVETSIRDSAC